MHPIWLDCRVQWRKRMWTSARPIRLNSNQYAERVQSVYDQFLFGSRFMRIFRDTYLLKVEPNKFQTDCMSMPVQPNWTRNERIRSRNRREMGAAELLSNSPSTCATHSIPLNCELSGQRVAIAIHWHGAVKRDKINNARVYLHVGYTWWRCVETAMHRGPGRIIVHDQLELINNWIYWRGICVPGRCAHEHRAVLLYAICWLQRQSQATRTIRLCRPVIGIREVHRFIDFSFVWRQLKCRMTP